MVDQLPGQVPFNFAYQAEQGASDFILSPSNQQAALWLNRYPAWGAPGLVISGPAGSGKTLLAHIWQGKTDARTVTPTNVKQLLNEPAAAILIDHADMTVPQMQEDIFHLYQRAVSDDTHLLFIAREPVALWPLGLADLQSRLLALPQVQIDVPDDMLLASLFAKLLAERGLTMRPDAMDYALLRLPRHVPEMRQTVEALDQFALAHGKGLTLPLMRQFFQASQA